MFGICHNGVYQHKKRKNISKEGNPISRRPYFVFIFPPPPHPPTPPHDRDHTPLLKRSYVVRSTKDSREGFGVKIMNDQRDHP